MTTARFKIGDFSQLGQVSVRTLRLYDELNLIKPAEIDQWTGYRYYTLDQLPRLNRILALKDLGLSLEQIAHLLKHDLPVKQMRGMLRQKQAELEQQLVEMQTQIQRVEARLNQIENENAPPKYEVVLKSVSKATIASIRLIVPHVSDMGTLRFHKQNDFYAALAQHQIKPLDPEIFIYHLPGYQDENIDTEIGTTVESSALEKYPNGVGILTVRELPAVDTVASVVHHGTIWGIPDAIVALYSWVGKNGLESAGAYRELHHGWRENQTPEHELFSEITLEIQLPVTPLNSS
jgi:DNA-binding transcriptional MerR regulator